MHPQQWRERSGVARNRAASRTRASPQRLVRGRRCRVLRAQVREWDRDAGSFATKNRERASAMIKREFLPAVRRVSGRPRGCGSAPPLRRLPDPAGALDRDLPRGARTSRRIMAQWLSERLGSSSSSRKAGRGQHTRQPKPHSFAARGYTPAAGQFANAITIALYPSCPSIHPRYRPGCRHHAVPNVMEVNPSVRPRRCRISYAYAKANPARSIGRLRQRHSVHLSGELFKMMTASR